MKTIVERTVNTCKLSGILQSIDVKKFAYDGKDGEKVEAISGRMRVITQENPETGMKNVQDVEIFQNMLKKDGNKTKVIEAIEELIGGFKTYEDIKKLKEKNPNYSNEVLIYDKSVENPKKMYCSVYGDAPYNPKLGVNRYCDSEGKVVNKIIVTGGNISIREFDEEKDRLDMYFEVSGYCRKAQIETDKNGEETGRAIITLGVPITHKKELDLMDITLVAGFLEAEGDDEEMDLGGQLIECIEDGSIGEGVTMSAFGTIENCTVIKENRHQGKFGRAKSDTKRNSKNEIIMFGGDIIEDDGKIEEEEFLDLVKSRRIKEEELVQAKQEKMAEEGSLTKKKGFGTGRTITGTKTQRGNDRW